MNATHFSHKFILLSILFTGNISKFENEVVKSFDVFLVSVTFSACFELTGPLDPIKLMNVIKRLEEDDADDAKKTGKLFKTIPAFTFMGVNLGYLLNTLN